MNRNCLFSKAVALLLCAVLLIGYLPSIALPAAAATPDWEGEPDVVETTTEEPTTPPEGAQDNPIFLPKLSNTVTVPAGKTVYYYGNFSGMMMTVTGTGNYIYNGEPAEIDGVAIPVNSNNPRMPIVVAIQNTGDADAEYTISFAYPSGHQQNPEIIGTDRDYTASIEANNEQGYNFKYTAEKTGTLMVYVSVPETATGYGFTVSNLTTGVSGDQQWSDSSPVNPYSLDVTAGDVIVINVCTYDPNSWDYPAGEVTVKLEYKPEEIVPSAELSALEVSFDAEVKLWAYFIINDDLLNDDSAYMIASKDGAFGIVEKKIMMSELKAQGSTPYGDYLVEVGLASGEMTSAVTYSFYNGADELLYVKDYSDGSVGESVSRSAIDYAEAIFQRGSDRQKNIVKALMVYGGYAQKFFNVKTDNLAFDVLTKYGYEIPSLEDITSDSISLEMTTSGDLGVTITAQEGNFDSAIFHRIYFTLPSGCSIDNVTAVIHKINAAGQTYEEPVTEFGYDPYYNEYYVDITSIASALLDYTYSVVLTDSVSGNAFTVNTSVMVWAKRVMAVSSNPNQINLAKAAYYYNQAANAFFGL